MTAPARIATMLLLAGLSGGCAEMDPFRQAGTWRPSGANEQNLRLMVADGRDLVAGQSATGADGQRAAQAVERLRADRVRPLPASGIARIAVSTTPVAPVPAGAAGGASGY